MHGIDAREVFAPIVAQGQRMSRLRCAIDENMTMANVSSFNEKLRTKFLIKGSTHKTHTENDGPQDFRKRKPYYHQAAKIDRFSDP